MYNFLTTFFIIVCSVFSTAFAQNKIKLNKTTHDFGAVLKQDSLSHTFYFQNSSSYNFKISKIVVDCACVAFKHSKETISTGGTGYIRLTYLPYQWGKFEKKFDVYNQNGALEKTLVLKGNIVAEENLNADFAHQNGDLRFKTKFLHFGTITTKAPVTKKFEIYNPTDEAITFTGEMEAPAHLKVLFDAQHSHIVKAKSKGAIFITYDAKAKQDWGYLQDEITMKTTNKERPNIKLKVVATVEDYFPEMTKEELAEMPHIKFNYSFIDLGRKPATDSLIARFKIYNTGKSALEIRKILPTLNCRILTPEYQFKTIAPNGSVVVEVLLNGTGKKGKQYGRITLFSNDPRSQTKVLQVTASIY